MSEESHLNAARAIEAAQRDFESLVYALTHDVRAPLRHIEGFLSIVRQRLEQQIDEESRRYFDKIVQASSRMTRMIEDIRTYAQQSGGDIRQTTISLDDLVRTLVAEVSGEGTPPVDWVVARLPEVKADRILLQRAVRHLVDNALKSARHRSPPRIDISAFDEGQDTVLCVKDNGEGFDMRYADALFKPFQRMHSARESDGAGIGLAIVARIVGRHGGRVWAEGVAGEGASFFVALPSAR